MNIKIIALRGRGGVGKTTTIVKLADELVKQGYDRLWREVHGNKTDIVDLFRDKKGVLIGVASAGDNYDEVHSALNNLKSSNAKIIICACRTRDMPNKRGLLKGTHAAMKEISPNIIFNDKTIIVEKDENLRNKANLKDIYKLIFELIK